MSSIWFTPFTLEEINERAKDSLSEHLGIAFTEMGPDFLTATMPVASTTRQPMGVLHGGASCALAETVGSAAANYCVNQEEKLCVGLEINVNHLRAVRSGTIRAVAKPFHLGGTTQVWEIKIYNEAELLIAVSRLTMAVLAK